MRTSETFSRITPIETCARCGSMQRRCSGNRVTNLIRYPAPFSPPCSARCRPAVPPGCCPSSTPSPPVLDVLDTTMLRLRAHHDRVCTHPPCAPSARATTPDFAPAAPARRSPTSTPLTPAFDTTAATARRHDGCSRAVPHPSAPRRHYYAPAPTGPPSRTTPNVASAMPQESSCNLPPPSTTLALPPPPRRSSSNSLRQALPVARPVSTRCRPSAYGAIRRPLLVEIYCT
ncbi:hypothetical protein C8R46DRAFT_1330234, partial [Mycena filopes]